MIVFPSGSEAASVVSGDPHLHRLLAQYAEDALSRLVRPPEDLVTRVQNAIVASLPHGNARADIVARKLGMSTRTLGRKLARQRTSFTGILDAMRYALALRYLAESDLAMSRIAWLLGYAETSAFTHAFRRWSGRSPSRDRRRCSGETTGVAWQRARRSQSAF
jgi:AraC-like DNA-binding protein